MLQPRTFILQPRTFILQPRTFILQPRTIILHHTLSHFTTHFHTSPHTFTLHHTLSYFNLHFHTPPYVFKRFQIISNPFPFLFSLMHGGKPPPARLLPYGQYTAPPSAGAQSPRPQRPGSTSPHSPNRLTLHSSLAICPISIACYDGGRD